MDPTATPQERWVLHEFTECANYDGLLLDGDRPPAEGPVEAVSRLRDRAPASAAYQRAINADGSPSETIVALRMDAAGHRPAARPRRADAGAAEVRTKPLDAEKAPNTVAARYADKKPFERGARPGDEGVGRLLLDARRRAA